ncbi:MAG: hypothetical protein V3V40_06595 [Nitrosomonadaceae bacterium]
MKWGSIMYQAKQSEPSQEFKNAWQAAGRFLQSKGGEGLNWIRSNLNLPMVEHLSFRLGNQLFFVFIEAAEFNFQKSSKLFLDVSREAKATPCIMSMEQRISKYEPCNSGWGLVNAESGVVINPIAMISGELIERSEWELHDFAIQTVKTYLTKQGKDVFSAQSSLHIDPSIWFEESESAHWVVVRAVKYPDKEAVLPHNINEIAQDCAHMGKVGYFASVSLVNSDDTFEPDANGNYLPLYRGHGMFVRFEGLKRV